MINFKTFLSFLNYIKSEYGDKNAFSTFSGNGYKFLSYNQLVDDSQHLARFLTKKSNNVSLKIAIISENNLMWSRYAFGSLLANATLIPVDIALSAHEISTLLKHATPDLVIYSPLQEEIMKEIITLGFSDTKTIKMTEDFSVYPDFAHITLQETDPKRNALIVYTSGSSGKAKGVMLSEEAIIFEITAIYDKLITDHIVTLSMLPINHMFEFTGGLCTNLSCGAEICIASSLDIDSLKRDFKERKVTQMFTVPLLISKIKDGVEKKIKNKGLIAKLVFKTLSTITPYISNFETRRKVFNFIHKNLAPNLTRLIVGGAKTPVKDLDFFNRLGVFAFEGYGLTETAPVITVNSHEAYMNGTVGKVLPEVEIRINKNEGPDFGELQVRGKNVMMGYYKNEELTKSSFTEDGWFKTGDVGNIDDKGFVKIVGRIKSLIVLDGGKKIHPEEIEELFNVMPEIKDASVNAIQVPINGKEQTQVAYVLVPSDDFVSSHNGDWIKIEESMKILAEDITKNVASYKKANKIFISKEELPKTSTKKIKQCSIKELLNELAKHTEQRSHYNVMKSTIIQNSTSIN